MFHLRSFSKLYDYDMCSLNMEKAMAPPLQYSCLANPMDGRILEGCSPWGPEELDMAKRLHFHFSLSDQLCDPMDYTAHGILQARILEWVNFPFSRGSFQPRDWTQVFHIAGRFFTSLATGEVHMLNFSPKFCIYTFACVCVCACECANFYSWYFHLQQKIWLPCPEHFDWVLPWS